MPSRVNATRRRNAARPGDLRDPAGVQAAAGRRGHHQAARQRLLRHAAGGASRPSSASADVIVCGESTSGCVRASAVDAYSYGFHVVLVEECCFDRSELSHKINLFDMHHKYADVMRIDEVVAHLDGMAVRKAG